MDREIREVIIEKKQVDDNNNLGWLGLCLLGIIGFWIISFIGSLIMIVMASGMSIEGVNVGGQIGMIIIYIVTFLWCLHLVKCNDAIKINIKLDKNKSIGILGSTILFMVGIVLLQESMYMLFDEQLNISKSAEHQYANLYSDSLILTFLLIVIAAPVVEEILYRIVVFGALRQRFSFLPAAMISAAIFGLSHGTVWAGIITFVIGVFLALLLEKTGRIIYPIMGHVLNNLISFLLNVVIGEIQSSIPETVIWIVLLCSIALIIFIFYRVYKMPSDEEFITRRSESNIKVYDAE